MVFWNIVYGMIEYSISAHNLENTEKEGQIPKRGSILQDLSPQRGGSLETLCRGYGLTFLIHIIYRDVYIHTYTHTHGIRLKMILANV